MDSEEKIGFLLTPKVQELIMLIAEDLEADGIKVDNYVFAKILSELASPVEINPFGISLDHWTFFPGNTEFLPEAIGNIYENPELLEQKDETVH